MENRAHALAAGLFVLLLGIALAAVAAWLGQDKTKTVPYTVSTARAVTGLKVEAPVLYRGLEVGRVAAMGFDPAAPGHILITLAIAEGTPVSDETFAQLGFQGVTGLALVQLNDARPGGKALAPGPGARIPLRPSLLDSGEDLVASFGEAAARVNNLLGEENQAQVKRALAGLEAATAKIARLSEQVEAGTRRLPSLIADAQAATRRAERTMAEIGALAAKLEAASTAADRVGAAADDAGASLRAVRDESVPRMNALLDQLSRETRALDRLITTLNDHPQSVVFGTPPRVPGPGEPGFGK
ncbi:MAG: MlaD family protein [Burkholderiales bacterium]|jgi:phospholipid/cholesterol/gamma-HCH transport system substrate-binding protein|nr:MlaD family protein [Burkholderiales bacterium]